MSTYPFIVEDQPAPGDLQFLEDQIIQYNMTQTGAFDGRALAIFLRNEQHEIIAGLSGYTWAGMCEIEFLWVHEDLRGQGYGSRLMGIAEDIARERGCHHAHLDTMSFQALPFYEKNGYTVYGVLNDLPVGHSRYFLSKVMQVS